MSSNATLWNRRWSDLSHRGSGSGVKSKGQGPVKGRERQRKREAEKPQDQTRIMYADTSQNGPPRNPI